MCACAGRNEVITVFMTVFGSNADLVNIENERERGREYKSIGWVTIFSEMS